MLHSHYLGTPPGRLDASCPIDWAHPLNQSLVAEWAVTPIRGWSGGLTLRNLVRSGKGSNDGTLVNGPTWLFGDRPGGYGAVNFDNVDSYVAIPYSAALDLGNSFTISAWIRVADVATRHFIYTQDNVGLEVFTEVNEGINLSIPGTIVAKTTALVVANTWMHIVVTKNGTGTNASAIYYNGANKTTSINVANTFGVTTTQRLIGIRRLSDSTGPFSGPLDSISVYNKPLTAKEVAALFIETKSGNPDRWRWLRKITYFPPPTYSSGSSGKLKPIGVKKPADILDASCPIDWQHPLNRGLVADWSVTPIPGWRGGLTLRDLVRGGKGSHDGTLINGASWKGGFGRIGGYGALDLHNSTNYVSIGDFLSLDPITPTLAAWVYIISYGAGLFSLIAGKASNSWGVGGYALLHQPGSGGLIGFMCGDSGTTAGTATVTQASVPVGRWYHFVGTGTGAGSGENKFYINGVAVATTSPTNARATSANPFQIGHTTSLDYFNGYIDGITLYNRVLSPTEVAALYAESLRGNPNRWRWLRRNAWWFPPPTVLDYKNLWKVGASPGGVSGSKIWTVKT